MRSVFLSSNVQTFIISLKVYMMFPIGKKKNEHFLFILPELQK